MNKRLILGIIIIPVLIVILTINQIEPSSAQQLTLTPDHATVTPINTPIGGNSELEYRVVKLEAEQSQTIEALKVTNERNTSLFTITSGLLGLLILIQGVVTFFQQRRDSKRDGEELVGVKRVNEIMTVVRDSFESRLTAEKEEREGRKRAEEVLANFAKQITELNASSNRQKENIKKKHKLIEDLALDLSKVGRHQFKSKVDQLKKFSDNFDQFDSYFLPLEDIAPNFSLYVHFIRGIAAHYGNEPDVAVEYLKKVISATRLGNDDEVHRKRVIATAYFYLGLIQSNFNNLSDAIAFFDQGIELMSPHVDFFTKIVTAESYIFNSEFSKAEQFLDEVLQGLDDEEKANGDKKSYLAGDRNRATLIRANMVIMLRRPKWQDTVQQLLKPLYEKDPSFYFAGVTLAQFYDSQGDKEQADKYFRESYGSIRMVATLPTGSVLQTEVRSRILFLMTAGLTSKYISEESESKFYLDQANNLCNLLPTLENKVCTVFSTISKRNESVEKIKEHIEFIRQGQVLLNHAK